MLQDGRELWTRNNEVKVNWADCTAWLPLWGLQSPAYWHQNVNVETELTSCSNITWCCLEDKLDGSLPTRSSSASFRSKLASFARLSDTVKLLPGWLSQWHQAEEVSPVSEVSMHGLWHPAVLWPRLIPSKVLQSTHHPCVRVCHLCHLLPLIAQVLHSLNGT